jgi:photosystem II stability/assembly factor-like uncharacterized protein
MNNRYKSEKTKAMNLSKSIFSHMVVPGFFILAILMQGWKSSTVNTPYARNKNPNGRNDDWSFVGIGGGGAMFNPTVSPHNPNDAFVSCDMGGSYATNNGGNSWRMFNLHGMVQFYVFDPIDSTTVYANSLGLFKSTDKGNTWKLIYPDPSEIDNLVSKGDHAEEEIVTKDGGNRKVLALAIDPVNSTKLYAVISINKSTYFCVSNDGGKKWNNEKELNPGAKNIFIDPSTPENNRTIYIASPNGITQRVNGSWSDNKNPKNVACLTLFSGGFDQQSNKMIIYAISGKSYFHPDEDQSGIYFTKNGGLTWENRQDGILAFRTNSADLPEWRTIATSAFHPEIVYVSYNNLKVNKDTTCIGIAKSIDSGKTWKLVWKDVQTKDSYIPSSNFGKDWMNDRFGPGWGENPFGIGISPTHPEICFATDFGRTIKTGDGGKTWEQVYSKNTNKEGWTSRGLQVTTGYSIVFDPFDESHVFLPTTDIGLLESKDGTASWMSATKNNGVPEKWVNTTYWLIFDAEVQGKAWAVMSQNHDLPRPKMFRKNGTAHFTGGVLITKNSGATWQPVSSTIGEAAMTHILYDPTSNKEFRTLYACAFGKGVFKSVDDGQTWVQKNKGIAGNEPLAWQITRRETDGALFLIVCRKSDDGSIGNDKDGALYKSIDGAENWTRISLPEGTNAPTSVTIDKQHPDRLVLSAWGRVTTGQFTPDIGGGIFLSGDEGKTWKHVLEKDQHISAITFDARSNRFYACGFEGSAYYSEDDANNWYRIKGYNFKWGQRVEPDPRDPGKIFVITFGGGVWHGPANGDKKSVEDVITPLKNL